MPELHIRFQLIILFPFKFLHADDGFYEFPCPRKKAEYGHEVQVRENDRQRGYRKVCRFFYVLDVVGVIIKKKNIGYA